jgi:hypothetical protein
MGRPGPGKPSNEGDRGPASTMTSALAGSTPNVYDEIFRGACRSTLGAMRR